MDMIRNEYVDIWNIVLSLPNWCGCRHHKPSSSWRNQTNVLRMKELGIHSFMVVLQPQKPRNNLKHVWYDRVAQDSCQNQGLLSANIFPDNEPENTEQERQTEADVLFMSSDSIDDPLIPNPASPILNLPSGFYQKILPNILKTLSGTFPQKRLTRCTSFWRVIFGVTVRDRTTVGDWGCSLHALSRPVRIRVRLKLSFEGWRQLQRWAVFGEITVIQVRNFYALPGPVRVRVFFKLSFDWRRQTCFSLRWIVR